MAHAAEAATASTSAQPRAQPDPPTPSTAPHDEAKTHTHQLVPSVSSVTRQEPQHIADKAKWTPLRPQSTVEARGNASVAAKASAVYAIDQAKKEPNRLHVATAPPQVQRRPVMTKQVGRTIVPPRTVGKSARDSSSSSSAITGVNTLSRTATAATTGNTAGVAGKTIADRQKLQQTHVATTLQQKATHPAVVRDDKGSTDEWFRQSKLVLEQAHMRQQQQQHRQGQKQQQQSHGGSGSNVTKRVLTTSIADTLLAQQQQVIRQQQLLRDMLQKQQQQQQQAQLQLQIKWAQGGGKGGTKAALSPATSAVTTVSPTTFVTAAPTHNPMKKKVPKDTFGMDLEALARVCIRVANARTESEMRQALEKMTSWLHRCTELPLLQLAQRDYSDSMARRRSMLIQQNRWPLDLQVKSEYITHKIVQMLGVFLLREKNQGAQQQHATVRAAAAMKSGVSTSARSATTSADGTVAFRPSTVFASGATAAMTTASASRSGTSGNGVSTAGTTAAVAAGHATTAATVAAKPTAAATVAAVAAVAARPTATAVAIKQAVVPVAATTARAGLASSPCPTMPDQSIRAPVKRDMSSIERAYAALKSQLQAKQVEVNQKAKVKRDAAKVEATKAVGVASKHETTAAVLAATYKRSMQPGTPDTAKKQRTDVHAVSSSSTTTTYRPPTTSVSSAPVPPAYVPPTTSVPPTPVRPTSVPPISPQLAQQFYDFDVTTRTSSEPEDKMYMPSKIVSKIMYKALPRVHGKSAGAGVLVTKRDEQVKSETVSPALNPSHSTLDHESHLQDAFSISDEAVTFMQECVTEFLLYFTSESRDLSMMQNRRTKKGVGLSISGANVVESMENLGFTPYARVLAGYNEKVKASQDAAARKKTERKNAAQQRALQTHLAARAAATVAMNASKSAAAGTSADLPYLSAKEQFKSVTPFSRVTAATLSSLGSSLQAVSRNVSASPAGAAAAQPAAAATITTVLSNSATDLRQQSQLHQK